MLSRYRARWSPEIPPIGRTPPPDSRATGTIPIPVPGHRWTPRPRLRGAHPGLLPNRRVQYSLRCPPLVIARLDTSRNSLGGLYRPLRRSLLVSICRPQYPVATLCLNYDDPAVRHAIHLVGTLPDVSVAAVEHSLITSGGCKLSCSIIANFLRNQDTLLWTSLYPFLLRWARDNSR